MARGSPLALAWLLCALAPAAHARDLVVTVDAPTSLRAFARRAYNQPRAVEILATTNALPRTAQLRAGQSLIVPVSFRVQLDRSETLRALANQYLGQRDWASVLAAVNKRQEEDRLDAGVSIVIPGMVWRHGEAGDDMNKLARLYYGDRNRRWLLRAVNKKRNSNRVESGERILIPIFDRWSDVASVGARLGVTEDTLARAVVPATEVPDSGSADAQPATAVAAPPLPPPPASQLSPGEVPSLSDALQTGIQLAQRGSFLHALDQLEQISAQEGLTPSQRVSAQVWIATCLLAVGQTEEAQAAMVLALSLDPQLELDPVYTSPKVVALLRAARKARSRR